MKSVILLTSLGLISAATLVMAAPEGRGGDRLRAADTNADGMISREEAKALPRLAKRFDQIDTDKNGQITAEEMKAAHQARHNAMFDNLDANKDGVLSRDEFNAAHQRHHRAQK
jgi:Ca2+-binding EF-hand superfamily protein